MTKQLLSYSGATEFHLEQVDLRGMVQEMTELLEVSISKHVSLTLTTDMDVPTIRADGSQMQQLVMNLITNASEAIGDRPGEIRVHLGVLDVSKAVLNQARFSETLEPGRFVYLEVSDTGQGMEEDTVERMFDPFSLPKIRAEALVWRLLLAFCASTVVPFMLKVHPAEERRFECCWVRLREGLLYSNLLQRALS